MWLFTAGYLEKQFFAIYNTLQCILANNYCSYFTVLQKNIEQIKLTSFKLCFYHQHELKLTFLKSTLAN